MEISFSVFDTIHRVLSVIALQAIPSKHSNLISCNGRFDGYGILDDKNKMIGLI